MNASAEKIGRLTTHVLDTAFGKPANGLKIELFKMVDGKAIAIKTIETSRSSFILGCRSCSLWCLRNRPTLSCAAFGFTLWLFNISRKLSLQNSRNKIRFILNNQTIELSDIPASLTLLDYLRLEKRLTGTKEGCAEGDCGACTILVGRILNNELKYETVNSCIRFVGSLDGCHIVTIEHLKASDGKLHPVQQAMVDHHGSKAIYVVAQAMSLSSKQQWRSQILHTRKTILW